MARLPVRNIWVLFSCFAASGQTTAAIDPDTGVFTSIGPNLISIDPWTYPKRSLREAPLTETERADIYRVVDNENVHDSFPESERSKERETVLSSLVADVSVAAKGPAQVAVRSPELFCGAANCTLWLFVRESGHLQPILVTTGEDLKIKSSMSKGFHDLVSLIHKSAAEQDYTVSRWNGRKYSSIDVYICTSDPGGAGKPLPGTDARCLP